MNHKILFSIYLKGRRHGLLKWCEIYPGRDVNPGNICGKMVGVILNQCFGTSTGVTASLPRLQQNKKGMDVDR